MAIRSGTNFLLKHPNSAGTTIAAMRATSYSINNEVIDVTTKDSSLMWGELLGGEGVHNVTITASGLASTDAITGTILTNAMTRLSTGFYLTDGSTQFAITGLFMITEYTRDGEYNDAQTFSMTLRSNGVINTTI